ncbi:MAG TPA: CoA transferase [Pseudolabrys sp.]|nr:CoA transferase [Pseudolabrys sp.]
MIGGTTDDKALAGLRVLDLTQSLGYASKLFADLGADVTMVEPPGGIDARREGPFLGDRRDDNASLHFQYLSAGKKSVVLDLCDERDRALLRGMLRNADIVLDDRLQSARKADGLAYEQVSALNPDIVWCSVTPFGQSGPRAQDAGDDMVAMAAGGMAWLTGYADRGPLVVEGELAVYSSAQYAAVMSMIAYLGREAVGGGQFIDVSMQEVVALGTETAPQFLTLKGIERRRLSEGERQAGIGIYPCRDGYVLLYAADSGLGTGWSDVVAWLRESEVPDADSLSAPEWFDNAFKAKPENKAKFRTIFTAFAATRGKQELFEQGQARHIAIAPINDSREAFNDAHLNACGFFTRIGEIDGTELRGPGAPYHLSQTPWAAGYRAPLLGEQTDAMRKTLLADEALA